MKRDEARVCILRVGGTNCDQETQRAFNDLGVRADILHFNDVVQSKNLLDYHSLVFPGGFAYGDYVRAGAILAKAVVVRLGADLKRFVAEERPILGICNGFQILVEAGLLPAMEGPSVLPEACLATNVPAGFRCMWIHLKYENRGKCIFTRKIMKTTPLHMPIAHAEGRFMFETERQNQYLKKLYENDQLVLRYCTEEGEYAEGRFPISPNGAFHDVAGICDSTGTILGLMPHPERACFGWQQPDWTRHERIRDYGDGRLIFESIVDYLTRKF